MTKAEKRQLELEEAEKKAKEAKKSELVKNFKSLFNTEKYYFVEADETGRHVYYGTFWDRVCLDEKHGRFNDLEGAINTAIKDRDSYADFNEPIFVYSINRNYETQNPWLAIMKNGDLFTFHSGYYVTDQKGTPAAEIITRYFNQVIEPQKEYTETLIDPIFVKEVWRYKPILVNAPLTNCHYNVFYNNKVVKIENGNPVRAMHFTSQKEAIAFILADKQTDNNKYPTVFLDAVRRSNYVYFDTGEFYKFNEGCVNTPLKLTLEQAIDKIYDYEIKTALMDR